MFFLYGHLTKYHLIVLSLLLVNITNPNKQKKRNEKKGKRVRFLTPCDFLRKQIQDDFLFH